MRLINDNIKTDKCHTQGLSVDSKVDGVKSAKYTIFYYNIIKFLQFFIGHKGFKQDLIYSLIYQYMSNSLLNSDVKDDDEKMYEKMNTEDW